MSIEQLTAVILCGGKGTRLKDVVSDRPKPMAKINDRPFLDILIEHLFGAGIKDVVLCTGFMSDFIRGHYDNTNIVISEEKKPLGTAGAIKNARHLIKNSPFFVLNGDSFCEVDLAGMYTFHKSKKALASIVLSRSGSSTESGSVVINGESRITGFSEKSKTGGQGYFNAGIYLFEKPLLDSIPENTVYSLEYDVFPKIKDGIFGYVTKEEFLDIGTKERYFKAKDILKARTANDQH